MTGPTIPLHITGTITDADSTFKVTAYNNTTDKSCVGTVADSGHYIVDIANCGDYSVDDKIYVLIRNKLQALTVIVTLTQDMIDNGGSDDNDGTIRELPSHVFWVLYEILNNDLPNSIVDDDGTHEWTVTSGFPETKPEWPNVSIEASEIDYSRITLDKSEGDSPIELPIVLHTKIKWKKKALDEARGKIARILLENYQDLLDFNGLTFTDETPIETSNIDDLEFGNETLYQGTLLLKMDW